jgi:hypothetical protein
MASRRRIVDQPTAPFRPAILKIVGIGLSACFFIWFTMAFTFAMMGTNATARSFVPLWVASNVKAATASAILQSGNPAPSDLKMAHDLAAAVVRREPANVTAIRSLGAAAAISDPFNAKAARLFSYAESLSRRDLPTQLWLIERAVAKNDIPDALVHYDRALRTNVAARDILIPVLADAAKQPAVSIPLAQMLAGRPLWWTEFADKFIYASDAPSPLALIMGRLRLNRDEPGERNFLSQTMVSLIQGGAPDKAYALFKQAGGRDATNVDMVRDGGFDGPVGIAPFDWAFVDEADLAAVRERRDDGAGSWVLSLTAQNGRSGVVARQLLMLPAGQYRLGGRGGDIANDNAATPTISLICADKAGATLAVARYPAGQQQAAIDAPFTVPEKSCPAVWLLISRGAPLDRESVTPWVDSISVRRM